MMNIDYLRISLTDRCNLRCMYCMPEEGIITRPQDEILNFEEILRIGTIFASLGIKKIRLTGGEPLVRKGILGLVQSLSKINGIDNISLTTNGILLPFYADGLKKAGVNGINISLDTLKENRFKKITRNASFGNVLEGIDKVMQLNFYPVKLNVVVMNGVNDDEIADFVNFASDKGIILRFIEFMKITPLWREDSFVPIENVKDFCKTQFGIRKSNFKSDGPAEYYQHKNSLIGFIKTKVENCRCCSRLRLTSTGELKSCLYQDSGTNLKEFLRIGLNDDEIKNIVELEMLSKCGVNFRNFKSQKLYMSNIGG